MTPDTVLALRSALLDSFDAITKLTEIVDQLEADAA